MNILANDGRRVVQVSGTDRRAFLDATLSQAITDLPAGRWRSALWLDVHGAPLASFDVVAPPADDVLLLLADPSQLDAVTGGLAMRTFLSDAAFEVLDHVVLAIRGEAVLDGVEGEEGAVTDLGEVLVLHRAGGVDLVGGDRATLGLLAERGLESTGAPQALSDWEIRNGIPRVGREIVAPHLPEEAGVLATHVHLAKGCYPGQEAVARMWMLGRPRRRLAVLDLLDVDVPPVAGDEIGSGRERTTVTRVTAVAPLSALAFVPPATEIGQEIEGNGWRATVRGFAGDGRPQPGADPRVTRRRDRA